MKWYLKVIKNYANFSGRARRKEYWMFVLFNIIFSIVAVVLDNIFGIAIEDLGYGLFYILYTLAVLLPSLAVMVRRLHDVGKSGAMIFVMFIPLVGAIWLLALLVREGDSGRNQYGLDPKEDHPEEYEYGMSDRPAPTVPYSMSLGDTIILIVVIWMTLDKLFLQILPRYVDSLDSFYDNFFRKAWGFQLRSFIQILWGVVPIGLAFAIKDKAKQMVVFVLGGLHLLYSIYSLYGLLRWMIG